MMKRIVLSVALFASAAVYLVPALIWAFWNAALDAIVWFVGGKA